MLYAYVYTDVDKHVHTCLVSNTYLLIVEFHHLQIHRAVAFIAFHWPIDDLPSPWPKWKPPWEGTLKSGVSDLYKDDRCGVGNPSSVKSDSWPQGLCWYAGAGPMTATLVEDFRDAKGRKKARSFPGAIIFSQVAIIFSLVVAGNDSTETNGFWVKQPYVYQTVGLHHSGVVCHWALKNKTFCSWWVCPRLGRRDYLGMVCFLQPPRQPDTTMSLEPSLEIMKPCVLEPVYPDGVRISSGIKSLWNELNYLLPFGR